MSNPKNIIAWCEKINDSYENYLKTSFFFKEPRLRASFEKALREEGNLMKEPFPESSRDFKTGVKATELAKEFFTNKVEGILSALLDKPLYTHQERAVRAVHADGQNIVVASGTASGKTECFLYPILFELYRQHLAGELEKPGVRALILYPMNALANDQRERLGKICKQLKEKSTFKPTFGQYIGETPENESDNSRWHHAEAWKENRLHGECVFREEMRETPPHILLTNYSMLEYLLIRPDDSSLFDGDRGTYWQFIILDEAHQYRGARGMEMGMLIRRLKQRLYDGGRKDSFRCIATSATISSGESAQDKKDLAEFAKELFGEPFSEKGMIFGDLPSETITPSPNNQSPRRYHAFLRSLEGAFLIHRDNKDDVVLNRKDEDEKRKALEIALCRECGQHYYVGQNKEGYLKEAVRDPSQDDFGVEYYLPTKNGDVFLCRCCGRLSKTQSACDCHAEIPVKKCDSHKEYHDRIKECVVCHYRRGGIGDPVQEIVHGSDGPNAVIATALHDSLHDSLPKENRKILAFADSRQEAAIFAWYIGNSYEKFRNRNFIMRAINADKVDRDGLSIESLENRLRKQWDQVDGMFDTSDSEEDKQRKILISILGEVLTEERRLSLSGVGLD